LRAFLVPKERARELEVHRDVEVPAVGSALGALAVPGRRDVPLAESPGSGPGSRPGKREIHAKRSLMASVLPRPGPDRIPPQNLEAEMAVIGSVMVDREMMPVVSELLAASDFYAHVHETIFGVLTALYERGEPLDKITVAEELRRRDLLDRVGGVPYISSLMDTVPTAASAEYYARIVREKAALRGLIHAGTEITKIGFEGEDDVDSALDRSEQIVYEVGRRQLRGKFFPVSGLLKQAFDQIDNLFHSAGNRTGVTSGFRDIDDYTAGLQPGNFIILAARPAMGKTSMALTMAAAAAREAQKPVAIFSLEMTNMELVTRLLCAEGRLNAQNLRRGAIKEDDWHRIADGMAALSQVPIYLDDSGSLTVTELRSRCRRLQSASGLSAIFIDYIQLLRPSSNAKQMTRNDELSEICRTLKATAKDLGVPVIALAQLNRGVESRNDKRPMLSDLRDSGAIEQEADLVAFLYRDAYYNPETAPEPDLTEFIIAKQRNGPTGTIRLRFLKEHTLFVPYGDASRFSPP
jgi:replicative DNA helicase